MDQTASPPGSSPWTKGSRLAALKYRAGGLHCGSRNRRGAARSADRTDRSDAARLDTGSGRGGAADIARHGAGQCPTLVAELGDLSRFANPGQLMACLRLVPSQHSSGASVKRVGLSKAGNSAARRLRGIRGAPPYICPSARGSAQAGLVRTRG